MRLLLGAVLDEAMENAAASTAADARKPGGPVPAFYGREAWARASV